MTTIIDKLPGLKPCPFCGSSVRWGDRFECFTSRPRMSYPAIVCDVCELNVDFGILLQRLKHKMRQKWNLRYPRHTDNLPGRLMWFDFESGSPWDGECHLLAKPASEYEDTVWVAQKDELEAYITERERKAWEAAKEGTTTAVDENSTGEWISIEDWRKKERER